MRQFLLPIFFTLCVTTGFAQSGQQYWSSVQDIAVLRAADSSDEEFPSEFRSLRLDVDGIRQYLSKAPAEDLMDEGASFLVSLPMPDGRMLDFQVYNSPNMMPGLAARYPMIQSFVAYAVDEPSIAGRLDYGPQGFHAALRTNKGEVYIDPVKREGSPFYISYYTRNVHTEGYGCGVEGTFGPKELLRDLVDNQRPASLRGGEKVELKEYKLAVATTGEFGFRNGNSVPTVLGVINTTIGRLNAIYEVDLATRFQLIDDNDRLIFLDGDDDPFDNPQIGRGLLAQNQAVLDDSIGSANYDIGHVLTIACTDGIAGVASGGVCTDRKGRGVTCDNAGNLLILVTRVLAHEVGHQFSAGHTWNSCPSAQDQLAPNTAFEPGSGSTIMSYAGTCGASNVAGDNDAYFHVGSLVQMYNYSREGFGSQCGTLTETDNDCPTITLPYEDGFFIPINTPFKLTANETDDTDNDGVTYCWEQYDTGPAVAPCTFKTRGPLFRSYPPTSNPERIIPRLATLIDNTSPENQECMPDEARDLTFRCTVRDNIRPGGGVSWEEVAFKVAGTAGPFVVSNPTTGTEEWVGGSVETVTWDVANTDQAPVSCEFVNILLSTDRGRPPYTTLAEGVPNDGSHDVVVPNTPTRDARIIVEANDNIFFDMSNRDFEIEAATIPGVTFEVKPFTQLVCLPESPQIGLEFSQILGYDSLVTMSVDGLPMGAVAEFSSNPFLPSEGTELTINVDDVAATGAFDVTITLTGPNIDDFQRDLVLNVVNNVFTDFFPTAPADGATGVSELPIFSWTRLPNVDEVTLEIATTPLFGNSIVSTIDGITDTFYVAQTILEKNTPYYWRIRPVNICGDGPLSAIQGFQVETSSCATYMASEDLPLTIPSSGTPTLTARLNVPTGGTISDLNVINLEGTHQPIRFLEATLKSPDEKAVVLFSEIRCGSSALNIGLDDEAPDDIPCPANTGRAHKPLNPLSAFNGDNSQGNWTMDFRVIDNLASGGEIVSWGLEICSNVNLSGPFLVNNDLLKVKPGEGNPIIRDLLLADDNDNTPEELVFTIVEYPQYGSLFRAGTRLEPGSKFTQLTIDAGNLTYVNDGDDTQQFDSFSFTVEDGNNGWLKSTYNIEMDPDAVTSTKDLLADQNVTVFPNPTQDVLNIQLLSLPKGELVMEVVDVQGRQLIRRRMGQAENNMTLNTDALANGVYFLRLQWEDSLVTKKISIQR
ncbi:MAG: reprolysin-like metallopeptidase [Bacteroidota bacterium]